MIVLALGRSGMRGVVAAVLLAMALTGCRPKPDAECVTTTSRPCVTCAETIWTVVRLQRLRKEGIGRRGEEPTTT